MRYQFGIILLHSLENFRSSERYNEILENQFDQPLFEDFVGISFEIVYKLDRIILICLFSVEIFFHFPTI